MACYYDVAHVFRICQEVKDQEKKKLRIST